MQFVCILIFWFTTAGVYCRPIENYCVTESMFKECTKVAALLLRNMDHNADPCNDFFQYACGNWVKKHPLQPNVHKYSQYQESHNNVQKKLIATLLDESIVYKGPIQLARIMMQTCLNSSSHSNVAKENFYDPLLRFMTRHGGMPLIHDPENKKDYNCTNSKAIASLLAANYHLIFLSLAQAEGGPITPFFTLTAKKAYNSSSVTLTVIPPRHLVPPQMMQIPGVSSHIQEIILDVLKLFLVNVQPTAAQKNDIAYLTVLILHVFNIGGNYGDSAKMMTLKDLQDVFPHLNWNDYLTFILPDNMNISGDTKIETRDVYYRILSDISKRFEKVVERGFCRHLLNYIWFYTIRAFIKNNLASFEPGYGDLQQLCLSKLVKGHLGQAVGALYVHQNLKANDNAKNDTKDIVANIKTELIGIFQNSDWLDKQTKQEALAKAKAIKEYLVYPDMAQRKNEDLLERYYANLSFTSQSSYFDMVKAVTSFALKKHFQVLVDPPTEQEWIVSPATSNCLYIFEENSITIPAAFMIPPFFYLNGPKSMNYGGLGFVVGHEIAHGFDNTGRLFDEDGDFRGWWQAESMDQYRNKSQCFIEQYGSLETGFDHITLDGQQTLGENIADAGGIKMAFRAYRKYIKELGKEEPRLPGLMHLTNNQLFFISSAQGWCGSFTKAGLQSQIDHDKHAFNNFRVGMQMTNSKHFHQAFQCKEGTKHNPDRQCRIWLR